MTDRIRVSDDGSRVIDRLVRSENYPNGPFRQRSDAVVFAAFLGLRDGVRKPLLASSSESIRLEVFERRGHEPAVELVALADSQRPQILGQDEQESESRIRTFEEYANAGLEQLGRETLGLDDPLDRIVLMVKAAKGEPRFDVADSKPWSIVPEPASSTSEDVDKDCEEL